MPAEGSVYASPVARRDPVPQVIKNSLAGQVQKSTGHKLMESCSFHWGDPKSKAVSLVTVTLSHKYRDYGWEIGG